MKGSPQPKFLPVSRKELKGLGITQPDIIIISGDAYVDHPSFAAALLGRVLWDAGFSVAVIPQPDWKDSGSFTALGPPRLFFAVSGGSVDSMVSAFTPALKRRSKDSYSPGGRLMRPDRAVLVYSDCIHRVYPEIPIVIGGIEASLRRFAHYDYWSDSVRQSVLADAPADILVYGMGETQLKTIAERAAEGEQVRMMREIPGTVWKLPPREYRDINLPDALEIPGFNVVRDDKEGFCTAHALIAENQNPFTGKMLVQPHPKTVIVQNPPARPLTTREMDEIYELPYQRKAHPVYTDPVPGLEPVRFSITSHRGCYGNCNFCALSMHQGTIIQSRSRESILREVTLLSRMKGFSGVISDIGGPSANMYGDSCPNWERGDLCLDQACISCRSHHFGLNEYLSLLDEAEKIPGVKRVFISSGLRYDLVPPDLDVISRISRHVSGHLKIAPEHVSREVTRYMNKPDGACFQDFLERFRESQRKNPSRQYILPYLMSGHPGCRMEDMVLLAEFLRDNKIYPEQVQDFTPTPMTASTCMYHTGYDPRTGRSVYVPRGREKKIQRAMLRWREPENYEMVREALHQVKRSDLIGDDARCLISSNRGVSGRQKRRAR